MMIKKVSNNLDQLQFNTCVSEFMIFTNHIQKLEAINKDTVRSFIILMNPFMPHLAQELWELTGESSELTFEEWPTYDKELIVSDEIIIPIQINGKRRSEIAIAAEQSETEVIEKAKADDKIASYLNNTTIIKEIYVKGKILNIVIKQ